MFRRVNGNIAVNESGVSINPCYGNGPENYLLCEIAGQKYLLYSPMLYKDKFCNLKGSSPFSVEEIRNLWGLVEPWRRQADPVSAALWQSLSNEEQSILMKYEPPAEKSPQTQEIVVRTLNGIIGKPLDFKVEGFEGNSFNRFLLEEAYPLALSRPLIMSVSIKSARVKEEFGSSRVLLPLPLRQKITQYAAEGLTALGIEHKIGE